MEEALTLSHLVIGKRILNLPDTLPEEEKDFNTNGKATRSGQIYLSQL